MTDATITQEERAAIRSPSERWDALWYPHDRCHKMMLRLLTALEAAEAERDRLRLKCGEAAPEGTEIYHVGSTEFVLCPSCDYEFEDPWDEPELDADADGWHGVIVCRNCSARIEVHSQSTHFWTAKLADEEAAHRAVADESEAPNAD